jgi:hypothetical protein
LIAEHRAVLRVVHLSFMLRRSEMMFLSSAYDANTFGFGLGSENLPAQKAAIEAELHHLPNHSDRDITVEIFGSYIMLEGSVGNEADFSRALKIANDIAGAEKLIFRVALAAPAA